MAVSVSDNLRATDYTRFNGVNLENNCEYFMSAEEQRHAPPNTDTIQTKPFPIRGERANYVNSPHVIAMVGLPARGKTYISKKLSRYLNWIGINTKVFNLGEYRRHATTAYKSHEFFKPDNREAMAIRTQCAIDALMDVCSWLENGGEVAEVKVNSPDYRNMNTETALNDFLQRIEHYQERYEPLDEKAESNLSFMKIYNTGEKVVVHKHEGHIQSRIVYYLMNIHIIPRTIYLTRHGESVQNLESRIGGDSELSYRGRQYATALAEYIGQQDIGGLRVWTSWLRRTIQTVASVPAPQERWKALNEIDANLESRIGGDSELSYRGRQYATALAEYIGQQDIGGLRVWTSWLRRTIQTVASVPAPQERWKALNEIDAVGFVLLNL
ncbi:hypothetical protein LSTR_LSTR012301 [Laodelphax striatellus]|uniref:6-phosphofructo-2-kinase domain-containing protein n=1 Tax=Laodelphax striatellus TaxID=195883 RepID=A0A482XMH5_LAOST|nr:hypothetical protein LSTR_LSTR012301 [Laodelphax striatellus]